MRNRFEKQLALLHKELLEMGALTENAIASVSKSVVDQNTEDAQRAIAYERDLDQLYHDVETLCLKLLLQQQPVASDLRLVSAALKLITDMERIGDQSADIAEIILHIIGTPYKAQLETLAEMGTIACQMVTDSIDAFVRRDVELVKKVLTMDDEIDSRFWKVRKELIELIRSNANDGDQIVDLLMIAKYMERIGDHAENVAEWVEYAITGLYRGEVL